MYKNNFVAAVKSKGRILRERDGTISLPFGTEYSLLLKNLESRPANVNIDIDSDDVLFGKSLILQPNSELELERFVDNLHGGNRFRFIQKTDQIVKHRGDRIEDGLIRIEFAFEKKVVEEVVRRTYNDWWYPYPCQPYYNPYQPYWNNCSDNTGDGTYTTDNSGGVVIASCNVVSSYNSGDIKSDEGITVKGGQSNQNFVSGYIGELESSSVIVLRLRGVSGDKRVEKAIGVKTKLECPTCGHKSKSSCSYCPRCGTALL